MNGLNNFNANFNVKYLNLENIITRLHNRVGFQQLEVGTPPSPRQVDSEQPNDNNNKRIKWDSDSVSVSQESEAQNIAPKDSVVVLQHGGWLKNLPPNILKQIKEKSPPRAKADIVVQYYRKILGNEFTQEKAAIILKRVIQYVSKNENVSKFQTDINNQKLRHAPYGKSLVIIKKKNEELRNDGLLPPEN